MTTGQIFDIVILIVLLIGIIRGWFIGLAEKVGHVIALIASCLAAHIAGTVFRDMLAEKLLLPLLKEKKGGIFAVQIIKNGAKAFAGELAYDLIFFVVLFIALLVFGHVVHILKIVDRIPVVGTLNKFGGALLGLVTEFIIVYLICAVLFTLIPQSTFNQIGLTEEIIRETTLLQFFIGD